MPSQTTISMASATFLGCSADNRWSQPNGQICHSWLFNRTKMCHSDMVPANCHVSLTSQTSTLSNGLTVWRFDKCKQRCKQRADANSNANSICAFPTCVHQFDTISDNQNAKSHLRHKFSPKISSCFKILLPQQ